MPRWWKKLENAVNRFVNEAEDDLNDESRAHKKVKELVTKTENLLNTHKSTMQPESIQAANGMLGELNELLKADSNNPRSKFKQNQYDLLTKSIEIVGKYEGALEASPGFWNQFKAMVNNFVEDLTGEKDAVFSVQKTAVGANQNFQDIKGSIKGMKAQMEEPEDTHHPTKK